MGQGETLMPTWEADEAFLRDYRHLTPAQKEAFKVAKEDFVKALLKWESMDCAGLPSSLQDSVSNQWSTIPVF